MVGENQGSENRVCENKGSETEVMRGWHGQIKFGRNQGRGK